MAEALKPAEPELVWNFLVEVALNADDKQRASLHEELSPGLANVQVRTTHRSALLCTRIAACRPQVVRFAHGCRSLRYLLTH